jgi:hypothetical protein
VPAKEKRISLHVAQQPSLSATQKNQRHPRSAAVTTTTTLLSPVPLSAAAGAAAHSRSARRISNIFSSTFVGVVQQMIAAHSHTWTLEPQGRVAAMKEKKSSKKERSGATSSSSASATTSPAGSSMARGSSNGSAPIVTTSPACAFLSFVLCVDRRPHSTLWLSWWPQSTHLPPHAELRWRVLAFFAVASCAALCVRA